MIISTKPLDIILFYIWTRSKVPDESESLTEPISDRVYHSLTNKMNICLPLLSRKKQEN